MTPKICVALADKVCPTSPVLPKECTKYPEVQMLLQRRNSDRSNQAVAFQGMHPGEAAAAMAARDKGHLHHAQIQRRLTSTNGKRLW
jgi:hypothetical protein